MPTPSIKQFVYQAGARKRIPVSGTFELTPRCNFNCKMCYIRMSAEEQQQRGKELTTEEWLHIGRQAVKAGMIYLLLTGGEPMLRPDFTEIYREMIKMGVIISVNTNATLVTPEIVECFRQHPPECVNVTLYGATPETYGELCGVPNGFARAREGIRMMREAGIRVGINTTFTKCNQEDMEALVAYASEQGLSIRTASYTFPPVRSGHAVCDVCLSPEEQGRLNARFEYLSSSAQQREGKAAYYRRILEREAEAPSPELPERGNPSSCMAGRGLFWMAWNGEMYPCGMLSSHAAPAGDFQEQWRQVRDMTETIYLPAACRNCVYKKVCPSCAAVTQSTMQDPSVLVEGVCRYIKTFVKTFLELAETSDHNTPVGTNDGGTDPFICL